MSLIKCYKSGVFTNVLFAIPTSAENLHCNQRKLRIYDTLVKVTFLYVWIENMAVKNQKKKIRATKMYYVSIFGAFTCRGSINTKKYRHRQQRTKQSL